MVVIVNQGFNLIEMPFEQVDQFFPQFGKRVGEFREELHADVQEVGAEMIDLFSLIALTRVAAVVR